MPLIRSSVSKNSRLSHEQNIWVISNQVGFISQRTVGLSRVCIYSYDITDPAQQATLRHVMSIHSPRRHVRSLQIYQACSSCHERREREKRTNRFQISSQPSFSVDVCWFERRSQISDPLTRDMTNGIVRSICSRRSIPRLDLLEKKTCTVIVWLLIVDRSPFPVRRWLIDRLLLRISLLLHARDSLFFSEKNIWIKY